MTTFEAVERAIGMALAPAFLLTATMTALNALTTRLTRILDRTRDGAQLAERAWLERRSFWARRSVQLCAISAFLVASQIMWTFSAALMGGQNGVMLAVLLSMAMVAFMAAMLAFVFETMLAERGPKE